MKKFKEFLITGTLMFGLFSQPVFADELITGIINNKAWSQVSGKATLRGDQVYLELWNKEYPNVCNEHFGSTLNIRAMFPAAAGQYSVRPNSYDKNIIIFSDSTTPGNPANNLFATSGSFKIEELTEDYIKGSIVGRANFRNSSSKVDGSFSIVVCP